MENGIIQNGEIVIRGQDIESLALSLCATLEYAAKLISLHEMGHAWSQQRMLEA